MFISRYSRMDTVLKPGSFLSVVYISDGDGQGISPDEAASGIRRDIDAIDGVAVAPEGPGPLRLEGLHVILKHLKLPKRMLLLVTDGRSPGDLDDLVGAGYVNYVNLTADGPLDSEQKESVRLLNDCGCPFMVTATVIPGKTDGSALGKLAGDAAGSRMMILRVPKSEPDGKKFAEKEILSLAASAREAAKDVRIVTV
ncbi:MAG: hypothetical protein J5494_00735 [Candidatus Methanomethylophilaceae archaeon]|nr:hypothetical protein [Candidatus Methanomethylophilaceae archaeon]